MLFLESKMLTKLFRIVVIALCFASTCLVSGDAATRSAAIGQCRGTDSTIVKRIRFPRGRTTAVVKDAVRLCTSHEYRLKASAGQRMSLHLVTGRRTSMTLYAPNGDTLLDGGKDWEGELPETGNYTVRIGTDATARYTLEVTIR
jgi:hypothetical protein